MLFPSGTEKVKINASLRRASLGLIDYLLHNDGPVARPLPVKHRCSAPRDRLALQSECLHQLVGKKSGCILRTTAWAQTGKTAGDRAETRPEITLISPIKQRQNYTKG
ncbi:hypothetical protein QQF64_003721 [Cirrhinus molitorella]|uniref:Uncharacterized protein n=1 Tax=Cirrhinus molitorella TaxID=172907 RepID=A0ABR3MM55_9TELE